MQDSEDDDTFERENRSRSRSRSPIRREDDDVDLNNLTPHSEKISKIVAAVVAAQLAPVKKNLNKLMESSSQVSINFYGCFFWFFTF